MMTATSEEGIDSQMDEVEDPNELPYDPDQDREERRAIRKGYRQLQEDGIRSPT